MTIEGKRNVIKNYCKGRDCSGCVLHFRDGVCFSDRLANDEIIEENYKLVMEDMSESGDIEEKKKEIEKYCDKHVCNKHCVLLDLHIDDFCYREKDCKLIDEMYDKVKINERYSTEIKEKMKNNDKGCMTIKGTCYEDVLNILCRNGYATNIHTQLCKKNLSEIEHTIVFWKEAVSDNSYQE